MNVIYNEDCLEGMKRIHDGSVDMVLCDLPYGTTQNAWDSVIPTGPLWAEYRRVCRGAIVLTAAQPFTTTLVASNMGAFKHQWIWEKNIVTGHLNAHRMPMRAHEDVLVFGDKVPYYPQGIQAFGQMKNRGTNGRGNFGKSGDENFQEFTNYPRSIIRVKSDTAESFHPTQKPVELFEYLIRTYTQPGETVLDNCMGSGTTAIAALRSGRQYIGFEKDKAYYDASMMRINNWQSQGRLFA
jgi:site-specific DNA-methyltransferase (adenine-specific)